MASAGQFRAQEIVDALPGPVFANADFADAGDPRGGVGRRVFLHDQLLKPG